jgi:hypothetical protein
MKNANPLSVQLHVFIVFSAVEHASAASEKY